MTTRRLGKFAARSRHGYLSTTIQCHVCLRRVTKADEQVCDRRGCPARLQEAAK